MVQHWREIVSKKRAETEKQLPAEWRLPTSILNTINPKSEICVLDVPAKCGLLSSKELEITEKYDAIDLIQKMSCKELSSLEVTTAFCKRAAIAHQVTNCLTEMFFDVALERAQFLDDYLASQGKPMGSLHGMPISIKDSFNLKGTASTIGYVSFISHGPANFNSSLVDILLSAGAVLYVKTNIPQTLMTADSDNNIFGRVLNPHKLSLGAGGSSGGEGALIAMRGSILGVGTDIAGSIRIPAFCDGTLGFKPSVHRIPFGGMTNPTRSGWVGIDPVAGPLAQSPRDLRLFLETVINAKPWDYDCSALTIPWHPISPKRTLTVGVIYECPSWPVNPPIIRALETVVSKLESAGHTTIPLSDFPSFKEATSISMDFFDLDNDLTSFKFIEASGEPWVPSVKDLYTPPPEGRTPQTLEKVFNLTQARWAIRAKWHRIFMDNKLDVILAPGAHQTAMPHDTFRLPPYTIMWNLVPFPACIIPFLKADKNVDGADPRVPNYDPEAVDGAPCHVQVIARNEQDEELMAAVEIIAEVLKV